VASIPTRPAFLYGREYDDAWACDGAVTNGARYRLSRWRMMKAMYALSPELGGFAYMEGNFAAKPAKGLACYLARISGNESDSKLNDYEEK
jgi:hypothetical protein